MNERLTIQDLTDLLAAKHSMTKKDAEAFVKEFFLLIEQALENEKTVKIKGLGTFKLIDVDSRESVNVNTGERFQIKGHTKVSFSPDANLRDTINKPFAHFETVVLNENTILEDTPIEETEEEETGEEASAQAVLNEMGDDSETTVIEENEGTDDGLSEEEPIQEEQIASQPLAEESIEETQGVRMLEQHIRDAKAELDKAGKSRVDLLARVKLSHDKLKDLRERKASLEARALEALSKNVNPSLINEVAEEIARLENLITAEEQVLSNLEVSRDGVEKAVTATAQRIAQFEQQMEVVKATEAMQRAQQAVTTSTVGASSSVSTAAESLKRLQTRQAERQARLDAAAQLEKVADGRDLDEKLAEAGIGGSNKSSAQDVLARLQRQQGE